MIVPIVLAAKLFLGVFYNLSVWYKLTNKTLYGAIIAITGATITIVLNVIWIPKYGYLGSAWANFFCYLGMMIISYFWGRRVYPVRYQLKKIAVYTLMAAFVYYISRIVTIENNYLAFLFHAGLLLSFAGVVIVREKRYLATQKTD